MGGRTAMTLACRFPERVDGFISVDASPVSEIDDIIGFGSFAEAALTFMLKLKNENKDLTYH